MRTTFATLATLAHIAVSSPFTFPLPNGFPNPSQSALSTIQSQAGGTLPNTPAPTGLSSDTLTSFRLIAYNELFEVAYFTELLANITSNATGYALQNPQRDTVITALTAVVAQEELHALNANAVLTANGVQPIQPCEYAFPVASFESAVALAATFTDVVLGTLGDVQMLAATSQGASAAGVVQALAGIIGQEVCVPSCYPLYVLLVQRIALAAEICAVCEEGMSNVHETEPDTKENRASRTASTAPSRASGPPRSHS